MWGWWCTQRTNLRVVDGIQTPNLEAADLEAVELEVQVDDWLTNAGNSALMAG